MSSAKMIMKDLGDRVIEAKVSMEMMKSSGSKIGTCGTPNVTAAVDWSSHLRLLFEYDLISSS